MNFWIGSNNKGCHNLEYSLLSDVFSIWNFGSWRGSTCPPHCCWQRAADSPFPALPRSTFDLHPISRLTILHSSFQLCIFEKYQALQLKKLVYGEMMSYQVLFTEKTLYTMRSEMLMIKKKTKTKTVVNFSILLIKYGENQYLTKYANTGLGQSITLNWKNRDKCSLMLEDSVNYVFVCFLLCSMMIFDISNHMYE